MVSIACAGLDGLCGEVFNRRTSNFATLGQNVFTGPGRTFDATGDTWRSEQYRAAGAPRGIWAGLTWRFGSDATL